MAKTYRGWAEMDDWGAGRELRRPAKRKAERDWKREAEISMAEIQVFVIINEWEDVTGSPGAAIVDGVWYDSEAKALVALNDLAILNGTELVVGEFGFTITDEGTLSYEEYYIQELEKS